MVHPSTDPTGIGRFIHDPDLRLTDMQTLWDTQITQVFWVQLLERLRHNALDATDLYGIEKRLLLCPKNETDVEHQKYVLDVRRIVYQWIPQLREAIDLTGSAPGRERSAAHVLEELFLRNGVMRGCNPIKKPVYELMMEIQRRREDFPAIIPSRKHTMFTDEGREVWWRWLVQEVASLVIWYELFTDEDAKKKLVVEEMEKILRKGVTAAFPGYRKTKVGKVWYLDGRGRKAYTGDYNVIVTVKDEHYLLLTMDKHGTLRPAPWSHKIKSAWGPSRDDMTPVGDSEVPSLTNVVSSKSMRHVVMLARLMHWRVPERLNGLLDCRKVPSRLVDVGARRSHSELYLV